MSNIVAEIRRELKLTQWQLADKLGIHQSSVSRFETGELELDERTKLSLLALQAGIESKAA
jgi:DNA-binding XRE family transcriptional regulator